MKKYNKLLIFLFLFFVNMLKAQNTPCNQFGSGQPPIAYFTTSNGSCNFGHSVFLTTPFPSTTSNHTWAISRNGWSTTKTGASVCVAVPTSGTYTIIHGCKANSNNSTSYYTCQVDVSKPLSNVDYSVYGPSSSIAIPLNTTNTEVGTINGTSEVSLSGGVSYNIPVSLPSGTANMEPNIAIAYNSQAGSGLLGMGWNMGVGSSIIRTSKDIYHDTEAEAATLSSYDAYALDGNRLILKTGTYALSGSTYGTKNETFSQVTATSYNGKLAFKVETKNGIIMEYGMSGDSRLEAGNGEAVIWQLNKTIDKFGNYIEYKYINTINNSIYLDEIVYTGNSNVQLPYNSIKFNYAYRSDPNWTYIAGVKVVNDYVLTKITIKVEGNVYATYDFNYTQDEIHTYLREVVLTGADGKKLNPTRFLYPDNSPLIFKQDLVVPGPFQNQGSRGTAQYTGDFNGDGITDLLSMDYNFINNYTKECERFVAQLGAGGNTFVRKTPVVLPSERVLAYKSGNTLSDQYNFLSQDYDGDSFDDVPILRTSLVAVNETYTYYDENLQTWVTQTYTVSYPSVSSVDIYHSMGNGNFRNPTNYPINSNIINGIAQKPIFITGDYNSDGLSDYITLISDGSAYSAYVSFPHLNILNQQFLDNTGTFAFIGAKWHTADFVKSIDYDGDGNSDIITQKDGKVYIYTISKHPTQLQKYYAYEKVVYQLPDASVASMGDFNGDRKTDLLLVNETNPGPNPGAGTKTYLAVVSNGLNGFEPIVFTESYPSSVPHTINIADCDGDGLSDIIFTHEYKQTNTIPVLDKFAIFRHFSKGTAFVKRTAAYTINACTNSTISPNWQVHSMGDFNGDGKSDILVSNCQTQFAMFATSPNTPVYKMIQAVDGFNRATTFVYDKATTGTVYTKGTGRSYPINNVQLPMFLVKNMTMPDGIGGLNTTTYTYKDARLHRKGLGFLGFGEVSSTNATFGTSSKSEFDILVASTAISPYLKKSTVSKGQSTTITQYVPEFIHQGNAIWWQRTKDVITDNAFTHQHSEQHIGYDAFGNVTSDVTNLNNGLETVATNTLYGQRNTWIPASPINTTITKTRNGAAPYSKTTEFEYYPNGLLKFSKDLANSTDLWTKSEIVYDTKGLPINKTLSGGGGVTPRTSAITYDTQGRFVEKTTNANGQEATAIFDKRWGKALESTDVGGLKTSATYDGFGRTKTTTSPLGVVSTVTYSWVNSADILYSVKTVTPGSPEVVEYFDILERSVKKEVSGYQGTTIATKSTYDNQGRIQTVMGAHYTGTNGVLTTSIYDNLDRVLSISNSAGTTSSTYNYAPNGELTTTVTNPSAQVTTNVTDAAGKLLSTTDNGGTINYTYDSFGNQLNSSTVDNTLATAILLTQMTYDEAGRQESLWENNSGLSTYEYNAYGELKKQNIANGGDVIFTYNNLGQTTLREEEEGTTNYTYGTNNIAGSFVNALKTVTSDFGGDTHITSYIYDDKGRVKTEAESIKGRGFDTHYTYTNFGEVATITYPSTLHIERKYDTHGYLDKVTDKTNNVLIFQGNEMNALGKYISYNLGNGKTSIMTYDAYGFPISFKAGVGTQTVQDYSFSFDVTNGNLQSRTDHRKSLSETFTYDNLERLTTVQGPVPQTMQYADNGNMMMKTDLGAYRYDPLDKIHAVTGVASIPPYSSFQQQDIVFNNFHQPTRIEEQTSPGLPSLVKLDFSYGSDYNRRWSRGSDGTELFYVGDYELAQNWSCPLLPNQGNCINKFECEVLEVHYIAGGDGLACMIVNKFGAFEHHFVYKDHLGSILTTTDAQGVITAEQSFDAWGKHRDPNTWNYMTQDEDCGEIHPIALTPNWLWRGFTGHEHLIKLYGIELINMNARLYDPVVGRMLRWDIALAGSGTQGFNRYSYALNNPLKYTDPSGNWVANAIGAVLGGYQGYQLGKSMGAEGWKMIGYVLGGAGIGALTGGLGNAIATSGIALASTVSVLTSSFVSSLGFSLLSGGKTPVSFSLGAASWNENSGWGWLGKKGNSLGENLGYAMGALANVSDALAGFNPSNVTLETENDPAYNFKGSGLDPIGHSKLSKGGKTLVDWGPPDGAGFFDLAESTNDYKGGKINTNLKGGKFWDNLDVEGVNMKTMNRISDRLNNGNGGKYQLLFNSCVSKTSRALNLSGVLNIGVLPGINHPYSLHLQMYLRNQGFRPLLHSYHLQK